MMDSNQLYFEQKLICFPNCWGWLNSEFRLLYLLAKLELNWLPWVHQCHSKWYWHMSTLKYLPHPGSCACGYELSKTAWVGIYSLLGANISASVTATILGNWLTAHCGRTYPSFPYSCGKMALVYITASSPRFTCTSTCKFIPVGSQTMDPLGMLLLLAAEIFIQEGRWSARLWI